MYPFAISQAVGILVSIVAHYLLMFVADLGILGAGIAIGIAEYSGLASLLATILIRKLHKKTWHTQLAASATLCGGLYIPSCSCVNLHLHSQPCSFTLLQISIYLSAKVPSCSGYPLRTHLLLAKQLAFWSV